MEAKKRATGFKIAQRDMAYFEELKVGYFSHSGTFETWKDTIRPLLQSPTVSWLITLAAGSLLRPRLGGFQGTLVHLHAPDGASKTQAMQILVSLRADPHNLVWSFDEVATLDLYTAAAADNYLCLDDVHVAIMGDDMRSSPLPEKYIKHVCNPNEPVQTTIITASEWPMRLIAPAMANPILEIHTEAPGFEIWPSTMDIEPWWMETPIPLLYDNYGTLPADLIAWADAWEKKNSMSLAEKIREKMAKWADKEDYAHLTEPQSTAIALSMVGEWYMVERGLLQSGEMRKYRSKLIRFQKKDNNQKYEYMPSVCV